MARILLKFRQRGRANRNKPDRVLEKGRAVLGSRPMAEIYVNDRLVSAEAAVFAFDGARLELEVLGSLGGVFVDGKPVQGRVPLPPGSAVQAGQVLVEAVVDEATATCTLTVNEQYLPGMVDDLVLRRKPAEPFALEDPAGQEARWGKSPVLARATWAAAGVGALALLAFPLLKDGEAVTRGGLHRLHRPGAPLAPGRRAPAACADCHAPLASAYAPRCASCHPGYDGAGPGGEARYHPYGRGGDADCAACHAEHRGADGPLLPPPAVDPEAKRPALCLSCHDRSDFEPGSLLASRPPKGVRDRPAADPPRWLHVDGFAHADHAKREDGRAMECAECHRPAGGTAGSPARPGAEFVRVTYARCLECHSTWKVPVHGRDRGGAACLPCHERPADGDPWKVTAALRHVDLPATESRWVLPPRRHDFRSDECLRCHVLGRQAEDHRSSIASRVFRHEHHLSTVDPAAGTGLVFSRQCMECHRTLAGSETLRGTPAVDAAGCKRCHTDREPVPAEVPASRPARRVVDMFHGPHTVGLDEVARGPRRSRHLLGTLKEGCLSCHVPGPGEAPMGFRSRPRADAWGNLLDAEWKVLPPGDPGTPAKVVMEGTADCAACHSRHENVGKGTCALCHVDRGFEGNRPFLERRGGEPEFPYNERGIFDPSKKVTKPPGSVERFDHFSRGHRDLSSGPGTCSACHDTAKVFAARRVLEVPLPRLDDPVCLKCHAETRYHR